MFTAFTHSRICSYFSSPEGCCVPSTFLCKSLFLLNTDFFFLQIPQSYNSNDQILTLPLSNSDNIFWAQVDISNFQRCVWLIQDF